MRFSARGAVDAPSGRRTLDAASLVIDSARTGPFLDAASAILGRALAKSAETRFPSAKVFRETLAKLPVEHRIALDATTGARRDVEDDATATCDLPIVRP